MADSIIRRGRDTHVSSAQPDTQFSQVKFPRLTSGTHKIFVHLPLPGVRGRTIGQAILSVPVKDAWAAQNLTATPIAGDWGPRKTTWNTQPALRTGAITAAQTAKTDGQRVEVNVTAHVQAVADGAKHYGWQITTDSTANNRVYGFDATQNVVNDAWKLAIDFTEAPEPPSDLSPNGNLTGIEPVLTFDFVDLGGASTEMAALNVQVNTSAATTGVNFWDSGEVASTLPEYDLAPAAWVGTTGTLYYWRVRVKDGAGYWSGWSDWASFTYSVKPTLTITQPTGGLIWDPSPTILASISSGTVKAFRVRIAKGNDKSKVVYDSGKLPGSGTTSVAHTVPFKDEGRRVLKDDSSYWLNVQVWDNNQREATPGDPTWTGAWVSFRLDDDLVPPAPAGLIAVQVGDTPRVRLSWTRTGTTDAWVIVRDGEVIARLDAIDVESASGSYSWVDPTASPLVQHIYKVKAIDNGSKKQTTASAEAYVTTDAPGVWLLDETVDVRLEGTGVENFRTVDRRASYKPVNSPYDVDVVHAFEGVVGGFAGTIHDLTPGGWSAARAAILAMKGRPHREVQLVYGTVSVPVKLRNVCVAPSPAITTENMLHDVTFEAQQTSGFEVAA